jgi:hypothetical protein
MAEISPSLLLSNAAQPADGVTNAKPVMWYGGDLSVVAEGVFAGASVQLVMTTNMPPKGIIPNDPDTWEPDGDWLPLGDPLTAPGVISLGHINPCLLAVLVSGSSGTTRVRAIVQ